MQRRPVWTMQQQQLTDPFCTAEDVEVELLRPGSDTRATEVTFRRSGTAE